MRQIILDTETTGLDPRQGHRVIEIAAVEMHNRRLTGNHFHRYLNPDRDIEEGALQVHGITREFLQDKPRFGDIVAEFLEFVQGAELIIHNAPFDVAFLDAELNLHGMKELQTYTGKVIDTLLMARNLHPGQRNSLDALCKRYGVDNSSRTLHGALLDCELLAQVYLSMTRGQETLVMESPAASNGAARAGSRRRRLRPLAAAVPVQEQEAHRELLGQIEKESGGNCLWLQARAQEQAG
ncbi:MAG: DNA polymerase III subunit epsilon [Pseudomonadota bacterium]